MVVELTLEVSVSKVYEVLVDSLLQEVKTIHPNIKKADIKTGFTYKKTMTGMMKQQASTTVKIDELMENQSYKASIQSERGISTISYQLTGDENSCHVSYDEDFSSDKMLTNLNYKLVSTFYKKKSRKKVVRMLRQIESYIQQNKEA